jgi:PAS domain S-box-containing protein/diguanylate cyclase (GGDEF)-like protein
VRIAVDVFGGDALQWAGGRSFAYDKIKIRRTLTKADDAESAATVARTIDMCKQRGIVCCAVGVETPEQLSRLVGGNCAQAQGHLFGQALAARDIPGALSRLNVGDWAPGKATLQPHPGLSFFQITELANDVVIVTTADLDEPGPNIVYVNPAFTRLTGYSPAEVIGRSPRMLQGAGTSRCALDAMRQTMREGRVVHEKLLNYAKSGAPYWLDMRIVPLRAADGTITHFAAIERDITLDKRRLDDLDVLENRDDLTGIPNRRALMRVIEAEIAIVAARAADEDSEDGLCVACIGIDNIDSVRERFGEAGADAAVQGLAERLADNVRRCDTVGHMEDARFGICMPLATHDSAKRIIQHLRLAATAPLQTVFGPVWLTVSAGSAAYAPGDNLSRMIHRAEADMQDAVQEDAFADAVTVSASAAAGRRFTGRPASFVNPGAARRQG